MAKKPVAPNEASEADSEGNLRRHCTLPPGAVRSLESIAALGNVHGGSVSNVMVSLIQQGIRDCITKEYIALDGSPMPRKRGSKRV